jgi:nitrous oxidase accessory protein
MQSNVRLNFYDNSIIDNLVDFEKQGIRFNTECKWASEGRGNYWSNYRGYDKSGDGIGELEYSVEDLTEHVIDRSTAARAFLYTPSHLTLESSIRMFPIFRPAPLLKDPHPVTQMPANAEASFTVSRTEQILAFIGLLLWLLGVKSVRGWSPLRNMKSAQRN